MLIAANWKAYVESVADAKKLFATAKRLAGASRIGIVLCPPAPFLGLLASGNRSKVAIGAQDISVASRGAHTGETTAAALKGAGAVYAIVGHSERRAAGETDALVAEKTKLAIAAGLTPILCIGETHRDADAKYLAGLRSQLSSVLSMLSPKDRAKVIVAYEPVWAIGKAASEAITPRDLAEMVLYIRKLLEAVAPGSARRIKVLYGGSVEPGNAKELAKEGGVDGFLVGRASTGPSTLAALAKALA